MPVKAKHGTAPSSAEVKGMIICTFTPPYALNAWIGTILPFFFYFYWMHCIFQAILPQSAVSYVTALTLGVIAREVFACLPDFMKMALLTDLCLNHNSPNDCVYSCSHCTRNCADFCGLVENASDKRRWAAYTESGCAPRPISVRLP